MDLSDIFQFRYMLIYFPKIISRFPITLLIVAVSMTGGLLLGFLLAIVRIFKLPVLNRLCVLYISFIRGTPIIVQLFLVYYGLPVVLLRLGINIMRWNKLFFVLITYVLNDAAFLSEIIRSALLSVPRGQMEAAYSVGLTTAQSYRRILIPQAFRVAMPALGVRVIGSFKSTAMAFTLGVIDMMGQVRAIGTRTQRVLEGYVDVMLIFIVTAFLLEWLFKRLGNRIQAACEQEVSV